VGVYATYGKSLGLYTIGLVLSGSGAEMAVQCGRDNGNIPKKLGGELVIRKNGDMIIAGVRRSGTQLVEATMKLGNITVVSLIIKERMYINGKLF
jgi:hypothetical protein